MAELLQLTVNGLISGSVLAMAAVGLSLAFGILKIVNYSHGELLTLGAYFTVSFNIAAGWPMIIATAAAMAVVAALMLVVDWALFRPLRAKGAGLLSKFFVAIGLALILRHVVYLFWGSRPRRFDVDSFQVYDLGIIRITFSQMVVIVTAAIVIPLIGLMLAKTTTGKTMRAISDNEELAAVAGVNRRRAITVTWTLAAGLGALAGVLQGLVQNSFDPNMGFFLLLTIFAAVILGGVGSAYGALTAGLVLGLMMDLSTWNMLGGGLPSVYKPVVAFLILVVLLVFRPTGLFGKARVI